MMAASVLNKPVRTLRRIKTEKVYNKGYTVQKLTKEVDVVINGKMCKHKCKYGI